VKLQHNSIILAHSGAVLPEKITCCGVPIHYSENVPAGTVYVFNPPPQIMTLRELGALWQNMIEKHEYDQQTHDASKNAGDVV
jgi:hypothetical protein